LHLIRGSKTISQAAAKLLATKVDKKVMPKPGLFSVSEQGKLSQKKIADKPSKYLLFLHGTISSFDGSFGDIYQNDITGIPVLIQEKYGNNVIALQHYTLSVSPWDNAIEILKTLPKGSSLDIISHSRGGLIADILAGCDFRNQQPGYSLSEIAIIRKSDSTLSACLETVNALARKKLITVENVIRIACPAGGTELLSNSLDHFLNGLLRAIGLAFGNNPVYQFIRGLITDVISARLTPDVMPGILAMVPESIPQKLINRPQVIFKNHLVVVEGDSEIGKNFWRSILVVFSNLYYREANDFVVNTGSMRYGALRESGLQFFKSQDDTTSHFNYFKNENTQQALLDALNTPAGQTIKRFETRSSGEIDRGVFVDLFKKYKAISYDQISGSKPVIILIPGVMGTHLRIGNEIVWLDLGEIGKGRMVGDLQPDNTNVDTRYIIGEFYDKLVKFLQLTHDVYTFGYDWRLSLAQSAGKLDTLIKEISNKVKGQSISIIAHSMGGLVVRDLMRLHASNWKLYSANKDSRVILLGTPWSGSHLIMEVFTGHLSRVRQINLLDTHHDKNALIQLFNRYPGLYDLLPVNREAFETVDFWSDINVQLGHDKILVPPLLDYFKSYKQHIRTFVPDLTNVYYLAGKDETTTSTFRIAKNIFGKRLQYLGTPEGDGSVTWELGIPKNLPADHLYYAHQTNHGNLGNDETLFDGIRDLIHQGFTTNLEKNPPAQDKDRSTGDIDGYPGLKVIPEIMVSNRADEAWKILQGQKLSSIKVKPKDDYIYVSVVHGDLKVSSHPIMVGHFKDDGIVNAEAAIDYYYGGKLSDRHRISYYPGLIGESLILYDPDKNPTGTIVIGLGEVTTLTPFNLRKTVEAGTVRYAMHFRDNLIMGNHPRTGNHETAITCLCIGSGYGNLSMEVALNAILSGVSKANRIIRTIPDLKPIKNIEFIELYEHVAQNAFYQLSEIENNTAIDLTFRLDKKIIKKTGAKRKYQFSIEYSWWHNLSSRLEKDNKNGFSSIKFTSSTGIARVEEENTFTSQKIIRSLLDQMAVDQGVWNTTYSKTLFEILVPNAFKEILRHQNNILWKMDLDTASYPWELFHDQDIDTNPTFVRAGLIRQLYTSAEQKADIMHPLSALVIADPLYSSDGPNQLPGAKEEGKVVHGLLQQHFETTPLINCSGLDIINQLYNQEYKIWHIAGHGTLSDNPNETGIVLEHGAFITPDMLKNMSRLPEFVFINCCYSGTVEPGKEKLYQQRYHFAANIGTQLIERGVHAAVVAGWPVNDDAALLFAKTFYQHMLFGKSFGNAVRQAREACWKNYKESNNTWGAYQCYGDPWYTLVPSKVGSGAKNPYFTIDQVLIDLYNLRSETQDRMIKPKELESRLKTILENAAGTNFIKAQVLELKAEILSELNLIDQAIEAYSELRRLNNSDFTVKSLEQYCNLRVKQLLIQITSAGVLKPAIVNNKIKVLLKDFEYLLLIGPTPERLNLFGSAYKKIAMIYESISAQTAKTALVLRPLKKALNYYTLAYITSDPKDIKNLIYPLTNLLTIHAIVSKEKTIRLQKNKNVPISKLFLEIKKEFSDSSNQFIDFWEDVNLVNILQCELFYANEKEVKSIQDDIIRLYSRAWILSGTFKQKQTKLDHLDFLDLGVRLIDRPIKWKKLMKSVIGEMRKGLEGLN
ncbi:MAG: CHAT domain-containing protein, partial [Saprospiraceae bacterium]